MGLGDIFRINEFKAEIARLQQENQNLIQNNQNLQDSTDSMKKMLDELGGFDYFKVKEMTDALDKEAHEKQIRLKYEYSEKQRIAEADLQKKINDLDRIISDRDEKCKEVLNTLNTLRLEEASLNKNG